METAAQFRKYNQECRTMALLTRDPESRASWNLLAERWARCAEVEEGKKLPSRIQQHQYLHH